MWPSTPESGAPPGGGTQCSDRPRELHGATLFSCSPRVKLSTETSPSERGQGPRHCPLRRVPGKARQGCRAKARPLNSAAASPGIVVCGVWRPSVVAEALAPRETAMGEAPHSYQDPRMSGSESLHPPPSTLASTGSRVQHAPTPGPRGTWLGRRARPRSGWPLPTPPRRGWRRSGQSDARGRRCLQNQAPELSVRWRDCVIAS